MKRGRWASSPRARRSSAMVRVMAESATNRPSQTLSTISSFETTRPALSASKGRRLACLGSSLTVRPSHSMRLSSGAKRHSPRRRLSAVFAGVGDAGICAALDVIIATSVLHPFLRFGSDRGLPHRVRGSFPRAFRGYPERAMRRLEASLPSAGKARAGKASAGKASAGKASKIRGQRPDHPKDTRAGHQRFWAHEAHECPATPLSHLRDGRGRPFLRSGGDGRVSAHPGRQAPARGGGRASGGLPDRQGLAGRACGVRRALRALRQGRHRGARLHPLPVRGPSSRKSATAEGPRPSPLSGAPLSGSAAPLPGFPPSVPPWS